MRAALIFGALLAVAFAAQPNANPKLQLRSKIADAGKGKDHGTGKGQDDDSFKPCKNDDRNKPLTKEDISYRLNIQHWARPWKVPDTDTETLFDKEPPKIKKIFYVNMESDGDRRGQLEGMLKAKAADIPVERFPAVTHQEVADMIIEGGQKKETWLYSSGGHAPYLTQMSKMRQHATIAVYLTQARLMKHILEQDPNSTDAYMIMEDDVELNDGWQESLMQQLQFIPRDWDIARFVYWGAKRCEDKVPETDSWYEARGPSHMPDGATALYAGNQAYLVRPKSIPDIMEQFRALPVMDVDGAMGSSHKEGHNVTDDMDISWTWGVHNYVLSTPLGFHKNMGSSRLKDEGNNWQQQQEEQRRQQEQQWQPAQQSGWNDDGADYDSNDGGDGGFGGFGGFGNWPGAAWR